MTTLRDVILFEEIPPGFGVIQTRGPVDADGLRRLGLRKLTSETYNQGDFLGIACRAPTVLHGHRPAHCDFEIISSGHVLVPVCFPTTCTRTDVYVCSDGRFTCACLLVNTMNLPQRIRHLHFDLSKPIVDGLAEVVISMWKPHRQEPDRGQRYTDGAKSGSVNRLYDRQIDSIGYVVHGVAMSDNPVVTWRCSTGCGRPAVRNGMCDICDVLTALERSVPVYCDDCRQLLRGCSKPEPDYEFFGGEFPFRKDGSPPITSEPKPKHVYGAQGQVLKKYPNCDGCEAAIRSSYAADLDVYCPVHGKL